MTTKSEAFCASISMRSKTLFAFGFATLLIGISLVSGCSFAPEDASAATNSSADLSNQLEAITELTNAKNADIVSQKNELDELPAKSKAVTEPEALKQESPVEDEESGRAVVFRPAGSKSTPSITTNDSQQNPPKRIDQSKTLDLTFDDLTFEMEKTEKFERSMLTPKINSYDGSRISLRGFIRPSFTQSGLTKFVFVRDNKECCFGPGAALYDCVLVRLRKGKKTDYTVRPVTVEGKFYLKEYTGPDGKVWSIYRMKDALVR